MSIVFQSMEFFVRYFFQIFFLASKTVRNPFLTESMPKAIKSSIFHFGGQTKQEKRREDKTLL
jgi:hypothetical protein